MISFVFMLICVWGVAAIATVSVAFRQRDLMEERHNLRKDIVEAMEDLEHEREVGWHTLAAHTERRIHRLLRLEAEASRKLGDL